MRALTKSRMGQWFLFGLFAALCEPGIASAQLFGGRRCCPCPPPDCATLPGAVSPTKEPTPSTSTPPDRPVTATTDETPSLPMLASAVQGGRGVAYSSPNMWGDFFGTNRLVFTLQLPSTQVVTVIPSPPSQSTFLVLPAQTIVTTVPGRIVTLDGPFAGGVVERTKISEDNNPLPRDRVFFTYDFFSKVPLASEVNVHNFVLGFEKTFFDKMASIEVRVPFASTLNPDITEGAATNSREGEIGNVHLTLKGLLWSTQTLNVAAGLGIDIPTGPDTRFGLTDGTNLGRIRNDSLILTPYFAYLLTPDDRWFFQNWFQFGFDATGSPIDLNPSLATISTAGRIDNQSIFQLDAQLGYWLYKSTDRSRLLTALAPFIELHYNVSMDNAEVRQSGPFSLTSVSNRIDELNLATGVIAQIGDNCTLSIGAAFPLKGEGNRSFDYQLGIRANIFFGPTARERSRATPVSPF